MLWKTKGTVCEHHVLCIAWEAWPRKKAWEAWPRKKVTFIASNWSPSSVFISACTCAKKMPTMCKLVKSNNLLTPPFPSFHCTPLASFHCSVQPYTWGRTHLHRSEMNKKHHRQLLELVFQRSKKISLINFFFWFIVWLGNIHGRAKF